jgi:lysophospholipase L1-like esterase
VEDPCKLLFFGDSISERVAPRFEEQLRARYPSYTITCLNLGVVGDTSRTALERLDEALAHSPDVAVIGFGMNDWRKGVGRREYKRNISRMVDEFEGTGARVVLMTLNPVTDPSADNAEVDAYSEILRQISREKRVKVADVNAAWKETLRPSRRGLLNAIHPNAAGYEVMCQSLMDVVPRRITTVLWQYNGREAKCNYSCPYCYYVGLWNPSDAFFGTIDQWRQAFLRSFGKQRLVFYLAFGEPSIGGRFFDILEMTASERNWELRMTSNIAGPLERIVETPLARDGRLHINASFHPLTIDRDEFLRKAFLLREHGIEVPVVYVAYPPFLDRLEDDIATFAQHGFVVHLRRFQGRYREKVYPEAYTDEERRFLARFMDDGSIKYMLNQQPNTGELTYSGLHFFIVDNVGNVGYDSNVFQPYTRYRCIFGNIHQGNFRPLLRPGPYPGQREGTVDGVANLVSAGYRELEGNNVLAFAEQGGVFRTVDGVHYKHWDTDFTDRAIRSEYNFPRRDSPGRLGGRAHAATERVRRGWSRIVRSRPWRGGEW